MPAGPSLGTRGSSRVVKDNKTDDDLWNRVLGLDVHDGDVTQETLQSARCARCACAAKSCSRRSLAFPCLRGKQLKHGLDARKNHTHA